MMKRILSILLTTALCACLAACGATAETEENASAKLGLAVQTTLGGSQSASAESDGAARAYAVAVAVLLDENGRVANCALDAVQVDIPFTADGKLAADPKAAFPSKRELGDTYGMKAASGIGKEWYEQADAFEAYVIGKSASELRGVALREDGTAQDEALLASCTISVGDFLNVTLSAMESAEDVAASAQDRLGLALTTSTSASKDAQEGASGLCQADITLAATSVNAEGAVTACVVDSVQPSARFDAAGIIESDLAAEIVSKRRLGDAYGMKAASGIGKEWYEQANAFSAYVAGRSAEQIRGIALSEAGKAEEEPLAASATIALGAFVEAAARAAESAS